MRRALLPVLLLAAGCATSDNPADGGLISGIKNTTDGTYQARVDEKTAKVEAAKQENAALEGEKSEVATEIAAVEAEIKSTEGKIADAKREVLRLRYQLEAAKKPVPPELAARVETVTVSATAEPAPANATPEDRKARLAALQKVLSDTRALAEDLSKLST